MFGLETWILNLLLPLFVITRDIALQRLYKNADERLRQLGLTPGIEDLTVPRNIDGSVDKVLQTFGTPLAEGSLALAMAICLHSFLAAMPPVYGSALFGTIFVFFTAGFANILFMRQHSLAGIRRSLVTDSTEKLVSINHALKVRDVRAFVTDCAEANSVYNDPIPFRRLSRDAMAFLHSLPWDTGYDYEHNRLRTTTPELRARETAGRVVPALQTVDSRLQGRVERVASALQRLDGATAEIDEAIRRMSQTTSTPTTGGFFGPVWEATAAPQYSVTTRNITVSTSEPAADEQANSADMKEKTNTARRLMRNVDNNSTESNDNR